MSRVLIVDDEKSMRITLSEFLKKEGYEADTAPDAPAALQMLSQTEYDIVVRRISLCPEPPALNSWKGFGRVLRRYRSS